MLKSDTEDMDCEEKSDNLLFTTMSDSFHSLKSMRSDTTSGGGLRKVSGAYKAIQAARCADMSARHLCSSLSVPLAPPGLLLDKADNRTDLCFHVNSFEKKRNITASGSMTCTCTTCAMKLGHRLLEKSVSRTGQHYTSPAVFVLAD